MDFSTWTRQDFLDFDARRAETMQPTPEELKAQEELVNTQKNEKYASILTSYWFEPDTKITPEFVKEFCTTVNAQEYIGDIDKWVISQTELYGTLDNWFKNFILSYF